MLGAAYAVEGSVRRSGNRLRVTAQLIGTQDGSHLWSGSYDKDFDEVLKIQDQIAAGLVRALQVAVGVDLPSRPILKSAAGYDLYQRGRHALDRFDKVGFESAAGYFEQALALDPTALRAAESLALVHMYIAEWGYAPPREGFERARMSCERVLKLDPNSAMAHAQLAFISVDLRLGLGRCCWQNSTGACSRPPRPRDSRDRRHHPLGSGSTGRRGGRL